MPTSHLDLLRLLAARLERLSVDSRWARRASGLRGNILKVLEGIEADQSMETGQLDRLIEHALEILNKAAMEIPDPGEK
ncbi:MAG: hypothetical protein AB1531_10860 [Chloroflexota bacterium]